MNDFEETYIMTQVNPFFNLIIKYYRYVDDTFLIFGGTKRVIDNFLKYINAISPYIQFTVEIMENKKINSLDPTVMMDRCNKIFFSIFRKPTTSDIIIPYSSDHPREHK